MMLNVMLPLLEQLRGGDGYEWTELSKEDGGDEDGKTKKEKEKGSFAASHYFSTCAVSTFVLERKVQNALICYDGQPFAEFCASVPELPPKA